MQNKWKKAAAIAMSLSLVAVNSAGSLSNPGMIVAKAAEETTQVSEVVGTVSEQGEDESYYDAETQTLHLKGYIRNSADQTGIIYPDGIGDVVNIVADEGTVLPVDSSYLFFNSGAETIDLRNADTSNVTDMSNMFERAFKLKSLDMSNLDTSNVTNMASMFCFWWHIADYINLSGLDTSNVTDMSYMFYYNGTEPFDLTVLDTSSVTDMSYMFSGGGDIIDLSSFDTSNVTNMSGMFSHTSGESLDLSNFDTSNVTDMSYMFESSSYDSLDISSFDTSNVTDMASMFEFFSGVHSLDLSSFDTSNVTDMSHMFGSTDPRTIYVGSGWTTKSVEEDTEMFYGCKNLKGGAGTVYDENNVGIEYAHVDGGKEYPGYLTLAEYPNDKSYFDEKTGTLHLKGEVRGAGYYKGLVLPKGTDRLKVEHIVAEEGTVLPKDCSYFCISMPNLKSVDLKNADSSNVTNMGYMFENCYNLKSLDLSNFDTHNVTEMLWMFSGCESLKNVDLSSFDTSNIKLLNCMFYNCKNLESLDLSSFDTSNVISMSCLFGNCEKIESLDLSNFDTSNVVDMGSMFDSCYKLKSVDLSSFDTSNVTDMRWMFGGCDIKTLDLSHFDTSNVVYMYSMFFGCNSLLSLDISNFDTKNVDSFSGMFTGCSSLSSLDLSSFDTSNVTGMSHMFDGCDSLETIIVGDGWSTKSVEYSYDMFWGCEKLKGGAGTVYDENNVGIEYAHVDGGKEYPGYLTLAEYPNDKSYFDEKTGTLHLKGEVRGAGYYKGLVLPKGTDRLKVEHIVAEEGTVLPKDCSYFCISMPNLKSVDLKNADSSNVTDMSYMFQLWDDSYWQLSYIDVSGFDTSNVTDMHSMFGFYIGTELNVSSFDTSKVTDMSQMFYDCSNLYKLDLSNFDTKNVDSFFGMFVRCSSLSSLDLSSFDTSNVTDMTYMFDDCNSLETIIVGDGWTTKSVEYSYDMFLGCEKLKGGAGTVYNEEHTDAEYARIDGGKTAPGYFTSVSGSSEEDTTIVIVIPEETVNAISCLYNNINNPTLKNIASTAMNFLGKYFSFKIV